MRLPLSVSFPDHSDRESYVVVADARDQLKWERAKQGRALGNLIGLSVLAEDLYSLAHIASLRTKKYSGALESFEDEAVVEMGARDNADEHPTKQGPSTDESSSSPSLPASE